MVDLQYGAATDVGCVRRVNEDGWLAQPPAFVVADGMGGHQSGQAASAIVIDEFDRLSRGAPVSTEAVEECLLECQRRIRGISRTDQPGPSYAGTTIVAALLVEQVDSSYWLIVNMGDSRAYRMVDNELERISVDHSLVQELVDAGKISAVEANAHPERHVVTRALGSPGAIDPDYFLLPVQATERLLLCSDGVTSEVDDEELARILASCPDARDAADRVVSSAVRAGGHDNATAVVVDVVGLDPQRVADKTRERPSLGSVSEDTAKRPSRQNEVGGA